MNRKRTLNIISDLILLFSIPIIFGSTVWCYTESQLFGEERIQQISAELVANETDVISSLNKIADWITNEENIAYDTSGIYFHPIAPFLLFRLQDPKYIMVTRRGACGEWAILFNAMAKSSGVQSRLVHNPGEDHGWCEVFVNGSWLHFDPGLSEKYRLNDPHFYEREPSEEEYGWGKPLSYVYALDSNGTKVDVTNKYTDTGKLTVLVEKNDTPVENAKVTIKSRSLMDNFGNSDPKYCMEKYTNSSGICEFNVGGNNYTIIAETGTYFGSRAEIIHQVSEQESSFITLNPKGFVLLPPIEIFIPMMLTIILCSLLMFACFKILIERYL